MEVDYTEGIEWMSHRKQRETKQQPQYVKYLAVALGTRPSEGTGNTKSGATARDVIAM